MKKTLGTTVVMVTMKGLVGICTDKQSNKCYLLLFSLLPGFIEMGALSSYLLCSPEHQCGWERFCPYSRGTFVCSVSLTIYLGLNKDSGLWLASCNPAFCPSPKVTFPSFLQLSPCSNILYGIEHSVPRSWKWFKDPSPETNYYPVPVAHTLTDDHPKGRCS